MTLKVKNILPIALGLIVALLFTIILQSSLSLARPSTVSDCSRLSIPDNVEVNTVLDKEKKLLTASWLNQDTGEDIQVIFDYTNNGCSASAKHLISHALEVDLNVQKEMCASMKDAVVNNITEIRGKKVNIEAGKKYIAQWCN
jgi:hypothetical protein